MYVCQEQAEDVRGAKTFEAVRCLPVLIAIPHSTFVPQGYRHPSQPRSLVLAETPQWMSLPGLSTRLSSFLDILGSMTGK